MEQQQLQNRLRLETSPYLLQHAENPVWWYPWGLEAFEAAKAQDKPIFLSIGYSTCYWCHVMEKDSFEMREVAELLNRYFISVKVDREERPDVDQLYMDFVLSVKGNGGWPLSVFLTPELKPFWGGTFFYRAQFVKILESLAKAWQEEKEHILSSADEITKYLKEKSSVFTISGPLDELSTRVFESCSRLFDERYGGFGCAPKFPPAQNLRLLLRIEKELPWEKRQKARHMIFHTLQQMARGGLCDQLAGGFHRYATDERWLIPHFEKMLYDNALLAMAYLEAYQVSGEYSFKMVATDTLDYIVRDLSSSYGGFFAAEDAGEVGHEGGFYCWGYDEIERRLSPLELKQVHELWDLSPEGNFEHGLNILAMRGEAKLEERWSEEASAVKMTLMKLRAQRKRPRRDEKVICSWNALAVSALAKGFQVLGNQVYAVRAVQALQFILHHLRRDGVLHRSFALGQAKHRACLEDYSYLIQALLDQFESDFSPRWIEQALELQEIQDQELWDDRLQAYRTSGAAELLYEKVELIDSAIPSANAVAVANMARFAGLGVGEGLENKVRPLLERAYSIVGQYTYGVSSLIMALREWERQGVIIICDGQDGRADSFLQALRSRFLPERFKLLLSPEQGNDWPVARGKTPLDGCTAVYVCENRACQAPIMDLNQLLALG